MSDAPTRPDRTSRKAENASGKPRRSPWLSPSLIVAIMVTLIGAGLWIYSTTTRPAPKTVATDPNAVSGFVGSDPLAAPAVAAEPRLVDKASPAVTRFGACFVAGFCVAFAFKKAIRVAAILTGVALITMFALQRAGVINLEWAWIQDAMDRSIAWVRGEAGAMKEFILGYLPSAGSAAAGMIVGLRKG